MAMGHGTMVHDGSGHGSGHSDEDHGRESPCAFAGLAAPGLAATDPIQLALLIAFVMGIGLAVPVLPRPAPRPICGRPCEDRPRFPDPSHPVSRPSGGNAFMMFAPFRRGRSKALSCLFSFPCRTIRPVRRQRRHLRRSSSPPRARSTPAPGRPAAYPDDPGNARQHRDPDPGRTPGARSPHGARGVRPGGRRDLGQCAGQSGGGHDARLCRQHRLDPAGRRANRRFHGHPARQQYLAL